ncbi:MAG TPA: chemotaxis protein CheB, partial [Acidocella sp.]|nr:chemotaxis protein CheB [Acidocella sp.]
MVQRQKKQIVAASNPPLPPAAGRKRRRPSLKTRLSLPNTVVALGASAGGLDPISKFLGAMSSDSGAAFVVIQHLDPAGKSLLPELLGKHTPMQVQLAFEGGVLLPNRVYVIPPGVYLSLASDKFHLENLSSGQGARLPVDVFLRSLAANRGNRGVGIILSGTGSDGALGLKALKEAGGLTLVQEPNEAQHDGMPQQAILTASPDYIMPVAEMPRALQQYFAEGCTKRQFKEEHGEEGMHHLDAALDALKSTTGRDFDQYKTGTVQRRIERRMGLHAIESWEDYIALLRTNTAEAEVLAKDLLIHVTQFFRDPDAFSYLENEVLPGLLRRHSSDQPVRIWVPGCSTGEEAYTLGMVFLEQIARTPHRLKLQIFATDIDEDALQTARAGVYPQSIQADIAPHRLEQFFTAVEGGFKVTSTLRETVIFSRHDLLKNPPFSRLDLISCRNLFIYLLPDAQQLVLTLCHFALRDNGLLFLGTAESTGAA